MPSDLTPEERQELENIRRRKQELLADIQVGTRSSQGVTGSMCGAHWTHPESSPKLRDHLGFPVRSIAMRVGVEGVWESEDRGLTPSGFPVALQRLKDEIAEVAHEIENLGSTEER